MAEDGPHEEGPGKASTQLAPADLLGATADRGRGDAKGDPEARAESVEAT